MMGDKGVAQIVDFCPFNTGDTEKDLERAGWYTSNSSGKTHPVAQKEPNSWGLYDMHGNVFEFCYDGFNEAKGYGNYTQDRDALFAKKNIG